MRGAAFARTLRLSAAGLAPEHLRTRLAAFAKEDLARKIAAGQVDPNYTTYVDGRQGAPEEQVKRVILYRFQPLGVAALFALEMARQKSLPGSAKFRGGFFFSVRGRIIRPESFDPNKVDADVEEVILLNKQLYQRQVDTGRRGNVEIDYHPAETGFWLKTAYVVRKKYPQCEVIARDRFVWGQDTYKNSATRNGRPIDSPALVIRKRF